MYNLQSSNTHRAIFQSAKSPKLLGSSLRQDSPGGKEVGNTKGKILGKM
jgi:hypothetical protein